MTEQTPKPKWINNEYAHYTGKMGVCHFCCITYPAAKLEEMPNIAYIIIKRFAKSINVTTLPEYTLMCIDANECEKWMNKRLEQAKASTIGPQI